MFIDIIHPNKYLRNLFMRLSCRLYLINVHQLIHLFEANFKVSNAIIPFAILIIVLRIKKVVRIFSFGIEHEVAFFNSSGKLADFNRTKFSDFQQIIDLLPVYPNDNLQLRIGNSGIRKKRWYIEGFERFANFEYKKLINYIPKGI